MYVTQLFADTFESNKCTTGVLLAQHNVIYVVRGEVSVKQQTYGADSAFYVEDQADFQAGSDGALLWRWTISVQDSPTLALMKGEGVQSQLRLSRQVKMFEMVPTSRWLFKLDCIIGFEGTTGLHSHVGSGIRCMRDGVLRTVSEKAENTDNEKMGDVWYEEGAYPLTSTVDAGKKATFLRGMLLPPEYLHFGDTATVIGEKREIKHEGYKMYLEKVVTLR